MVSVTLTFLSFLPCELITISQYILVGAPSFSEPESIHPALLIPHYGRFDPTFPPVVLELDFASFTAVIASVPCFPY